MQNEQELTKMYIRVSPLKNSGDMVLEMYSSIMYIATEKPETYNDDKVENEELIYEEKLSRCIADRENAYKWLNQDELRFDDWKNNTNTWQKAIEDIKAKYPKPEKPTSVIQKEQEQGISEKVIIPEFITRKQAKLILKQKGLLEQVESTLSGASELQKIEWDESLHFERNNPVLLSIAQSLNLSDEQIDQMFVEAKTL